MSKYSYEVTRLINEVSKLSSDELMDTYGIEIYQDGKVYDTVEEIVFDSIGEWAKMTVENDEPMYMTGNKRGKFDDDDYY